MIALCSNNTYYKFPIIHIALHITLSILFLMQNAIHIKIKFEKTSLKLVDICTCQLPLKKLDIKTPNGIHSLGQKIYLPIHFILFYCISKKCNTLLI